MHIHILQAVQSRNLRSSKDTNGGYGTVNDFGRGIVSTFLKRLKSQTMNFPEILPAYAQAILKGQGHRVTFGVNVMHPEAQVALLQTSIVNYQYELDWAERIHREAPQARVGFMGGMAAGNPQSYADRCEFVLTGEAEGALLQGDIADFSGVVTGQPVADLDGLPFPDWSHLPRQVNRYGFFNTHGGAFLPVQSSRGCPMSCAYYCTYPLVQGRTYRGRSPENVVEEITVLQRDYGMTTVMFRDPIFSLKMERVAKLCELILQRGLHFEWICETHPRFLEEGLIALMRRAGCVSVKLGIESGNLEVMKKSRRASPDLVNQEEIIRCLEKHGIRVMGFYMLGYPQDTPETVRQTIDYAIHLNTYGAQFTIATPYPGTPWYQDLAAEGGQELDPEWEHYNQYRLVFKHPNLTFEELERFKSEAYRRYYLRPSFAWKHLLP